MKTLFVHLSDLHLNTKNRHKINVQTIVDSLRDKIEACSNVFIIFTGDFSDSGSVEELTNFKSLLSSIKSKIQDISSSEVNVVLVPGNHDVDLTNENPKKYLVDSSKKYSESELDDLSFKSLDNIKEAIKVCNSFGCFLNNGFVDDLSFESENAIYHFNLINSAPLSSKQYRDKEHHHIPNCFLETIHQDLRIGKKTIEIFVSHHRPDWFDYNSSNRINNFINNKTSIVFFGHDHKQDESIVIRDDSPLLMLQGGELIDKSNDLCGSLNVLILDEGTFEITYGRHYYDYSSNESKYEEKHLEFPLNFFSLFKNNKVFVDNEFKSPLKASKGTIADLFVMPTLYKNDKPYISDFAQLIAYVDNTKEFFVKGNAKCGKSILLKALYLYYSKEYVPLLLKCSTNISPIVKNSIDTAFKEQYEGGNEKLKAFDALGKDKKVILIDNFHYLRKDVMEKMISYAREHYELVIVAYASSYDPTKRLIEESIAGYDNVFELYSFSYLNRKRYVENICKLMGLDGKKSNKVFKVYEATVGTSKILDFGDPDYALQLVESIISSDYYEERYAESAFSIAFTNSIANAFKEAGCGAKLENCIQLTSWLARDLWRRNDSFSFDEQFINNSYASCCDYYKTITLPFSRFFDLLKSSQIIVTLDDNSYSFRRPIFLSYFTGLQISNDCKGKNQNDLNMLLNNIGYGINSDVLLFVSYELKEKELFERINNEISCLFSEYEPINFNSKNNPVLKSLSKGDVFLEKEISFTKDEYEQEKDEEEKRQLPAQTRDAEDLNSNNNEDDKNIIKSLKLIEIMSKALSGFSTLFNGEERELYIKTVINACLRIVQRLFTISPEQFEAMKRVLDKAKEEIKELSRDKKALEKIQGLIGSLSLEGILYSYLVNVTSSIEFSISDWMSSGISMPIIEKLPNDLVTNSLFKLCSFIHMGAFEKFKNQFTKSSNMYKGDNSMSVIFNPTIIMYILQNVISPKELQELANVSEFSEKALKSMIPVGQINYNK